MPFRFWIVDNVIIPLIKFLIFPLQLVLSPLFRRLEIRLALQEQARFEDTIRKELDFLFNEHQAEVIPNYGVPFPPGFDGAFVTIAVRELRLQFSKGRGDFNSNITAAATPNDWHDLAAVLGIVDKSDDVHRESLQTLAQVGPALRRRECPTFR